MQPNERGADCKVRQVVVYKVQQMAGYKVRFFRASKVVLYKVSQLMKFWRNSSRYNV